MKTIATVNCILPTVEDSIDYASGQSLSDFDIVLFNPKFPCQDRVFFSGGGSCVSIEGAKKLKNSMSHWAKELGEAIRAGKTVFFLLNEYENDIGASGVNIGTRNTRNYSTFSINNYEVLPVRFGVRNAKGKYFKIADNMFKGLYDVIKDIAEYRVVFTSEVTWRVFLTKDGSSVISAVIRVKDCAGSIVLLPYFNLAGMTRTDEKKDEEYWTKEALNLSKRIVGQLVGIDKVLKSQNMETPKPEWVESVKQPIAVDEIDKKIKECEEKILSLKALKEREEEERRALLAYSALL